MTVQEALEDVYENTNEQDDLAPYTADVFDLTSPGALKLLRVFKRAAQVLSTWKFTDGRRLRFRNTETEDIATITPLSGATTQTVWPASTLLLGAGLDGTNNAYAKRLFVLDDTAHFVVGSALLTVTLGDVVSAAPQSAAFKLLERDFDYVSLGLSRKPVDFIGVYDVTNDAPITKADSNERFQSNSKSFGTPTQFTRIGDTLRFDQFIDTQTSYLVRYIRYLELGVLEVDPLCECPEAFHDVLLLWVMHWALRRDGDFTGAAQSWNEMLALIDRLRPQADFDADYGQIRMSQSS